MKKSRPAFKDLSSKKCHFLQYFQTVELQFLNRTTLKKNIKKENRQWKL